MPHIELGNDLPGIMSLFAFRPETAGPLNELAEVLLRGPSTLSRGERELIAARVSHLNGCYFCTHCHAAFAAAQLDEGMPLVDRVRSDPACAPVSDKLKALLALAGAVQDGGRQVKDHHMDTARAAGATDTEIHDTVLIAAAFCMYNRYVDGLATIAPDRPSAYTEMAEWIAVHGYRAASQPQA
ncbi:carboxymuconolactone decarboxylase family protein [Streptomyces melanogenes]|uniref:carboxymuconolactone decarboxylase family protein n=1 Tax=Streptomyces melanogenes TaxID=67326 RepID=UPI00167D3A67|nr:carboxymuconolactone decarboxylase family protein [Streptomyces melanogenes]GGP86364.1 carboxymuconolactone decarboxylase [Streptomyces melanogenes]